jgi:hypothetical protein
MSSFFDEDGDGNSSPPLTVGVHSTPPARTPPTPSPVPLPRTGRPPLYVKTKLTAEQKTKIQEKGIAGKGRKTKKRKPKSRRRRNGRTYRRS